jgi:hypothetical protein
MQKLHEVIDALRVPLGVPFEEGMAVKVKTRKATLQTLHYHLLMQPTISLHFNNCLVNAMKFYQT